MIGSNLTGRMKFFSGDFPGFKTSMTFAAFNINGKCPTARILLKVTMTVWCNLATVVLGLYLLWGPFQAFSLFFKLLLWTSHQTLAHPCCFLGVCIGRFFMFFRRPCAGLRVPGDVVGWEVKTPGKCFEIKFALSLGLLTQEFVVLFQFGTFSNPSANFL